MNKETFFLGNNFSGENYSYGGLNDYQIKVVSLLFQDGWLGEVDKFLDQNEFNYGGFILKNIVGTAKDLYHITGVVPTLDTVRMSMQQKEPENTEYYEEVFEEISQVIIEDSEKEAIKANFIYWSPVVFLLKIRNNSDAWVREYKKCTPASTRKVLNAIRDITKEMEDMLKRFEDKTIESKEDIYNEEI